MTENELIEVLKNNYPKTCKMVNGRYQGGFDDTECDFGQALTSAISALKEIQQYREIGTVEQVRNQKHNLEMAYKIISDYEAIGTVEECREAVDKQKAKKIIIESYCPTECPTCGYELSTSIGDGYYKHPTFLERCPKCGQAIQWDENLEGMEDE